MTGDNKNISYTLADIRRYLDGELSAGEMHELEKAALEDPFLGDALEGLERDRLERGTEAFTNDLSDLKKSLEERTGRKPSFAAVPASAWWRVAAAVVVLAGLGALLYRTGDLEKSAGRRLAKEDAVPAASQPVNPVPPAVADSAVSSPGGNRAGKPKNAGAPAVNAPAVNETTSRSSAAPVKNRETGRKQKSPATSENIAPAVAALKKDSAAMAGIMETTADKSFGRIPGLRIQAEAVNQFSGRVIGTDNHPIAHASVSLADRLLNTSTDSSGIFTMNLSRRDSLVNITIQSPGYQALTTHLRSDNYFDEQSAENMGAPDHSVTYHNIIRMQPAQAISVGEADGYSSQHKDKAVISPASSSPVLPRFATGPGTSKISVGNAVPSEGWAVYNEYLRQNKRIGTADSLLKGTEILSFIVDRNGALSGFKVEKSLSAEHDKEAMRLVMQGPSWKLLRGKKEKATLVITF